MERSQYLAQALAAMSAQPQAGMMQPDLGDTGQQSMAAQAWKAANPGQSYLLHGLQQAGQNIMDLPQRLGGLFSLGKAAGG